MKADEWKTFCNVNLVHTLAHLWDTYPESSRHRRLLDNYMDLVTATKLATNRILTCWNINECRTHIQRYLRNLRELFPHRNISPNQHLLAHLPQVLADFGPTHAWRCFPFERYNYILQQVNTNKKPGKRCVLTYKIVTYSHLGEMEVTMFERFCMMQSLRALMQADLPSELAELQEKFLSVFGPDLGGSAMQDLWSSEASVPDYQNTNKSQALDRETWELLKGWFAKNTGGNHAKQDVFFQRSVTRWNMRYSVRIGRTHQGDSNVVWGDLSGDTWCAGRIKSIFVWPGNTPQVFAVVDELPRVSLITSANLDPWRRYRSSVAGRLFEDRAVRSRILHLDEIACHSAVTPLVLKQSSKRRLHIMPLERVSAVLESPL